MTDDAMDWVWKHSRTRGNTRLLMLAIADAITGPDATAPMGTAEIMGRLNTTAKSTARDAVEAALDSGELTIAQPAAGRRAARYCIPGAVNYTSACGRESRTQPTFCGRESRTQTEAELSLWSEVPDTNDLWSGIPDTTPPASGRESRTQTDREDHPEKCATRTRASFKDTHEGMNEGVSADGPPSSVAPDFAVELVDKITAAQIYPAWDLTPGEWLRIDAMLKRSGADMLATVAVQIATKKRIGHARYFLRAWQSLPALPAPGTVVPPAGPGADVLPFAAPAGAPRKPGRAARAAAVMAAALEQENHG
ncbi:hypothetical protein [Streptomyces halstedii]|uniref:Helix-turn-helix domain-containing protein n=1 Tax=Streptomyces halstedii TaxID=1944 RepID=A0A6N9U7J0_STRHA|nr:hypothetical protein [Streptomyces halstedii]NEA19844.1 hypothetical protein [Streptomyces halstedii]